MNWQIIKQKKEQRAALHAEIKAIVEKAQTEQRDLTTEETKQYDGYLADIEAVTKTIERFEKGAQLENQIGHTAEQRGNIGREDIRVIEDAPEKRAAKQKEAFRSYIRGGFAQLNNEQRGILSTAEVEDRALTIGGIGVVAPQSFGDVFTHAMKVYTGVREAGAKIVSTSNGTPLPFAACDDTTNTGEIVGEGSSVTVDTNPTFSNIVLNGYKYSSKVMKYSLELLQDNAFDLESQLARDAAERIGRILNTHCTTGDNSNKPNGILNVITTGVMSDDLGIISYDNLIDLEHSLDPAYRANRQLCAWMMNDTTLAAVRKLKDDYGRPIFEPANSIAPATLMGYRVQVNNDMPSITTAVETDQLIVFGDYSRYVCRDVVPPIVLRLNELYAANGLVGFVTFSRHDGEVLDSKGFKALLNTSASNH